MKNAVPPTMAAAPSRPCCGLHSNAIGFGQGAYCGQVPDLELAASPRKLYFATATAQGEVRSGYHGCPAELSAGSTIFLIFLGGFL